MSKKIIEDLTPEQDARLDEFEKKWTARGLDLKPIDRERAEEALRKCYTAQKMKAPTRIEWLASPFAMLVRGAELEYVQKAIDSGTEVSLAMSNATALFRSDQTLSGDAQTAIRDLYGSICFGQHDSAWLGFQDFMNEVVGLKEETEELSALWEMAQEGHWWLPFENICLASERPIEMFLLNGNLHKEGGPAIRYADDFGLFALNGVEVPEWLAVLPKEKLVAKNILALTNAQQRAAGIKRIGFGPMLNELKAETIHEMDDYRLLSIEFEGQRIGPYLAMKNPSTGEIHCEGVGEPTGGVDPKIKTCEQALAWRNQTEKFIKPSVLT